MEYLAGVNPAVNICMHDFKRSGRDSLLLLFALHVHSTKVYTYMHGSDYVRPIPASNGSAGHW